MMPEASRDSESNQLHKTLKNIHWLFWALTLFSLLHGVYVHIKMAEAAIDFSIHDTMFVVSAVYAIGFQTLLFFMFGLAYYLFYNKDRYKPIYLLSIVHIVLTIGGLSVLFFMSNFLNEQPLNHTGDIYETMSRNSMKRNIKAYSGLGVFLAQILFLVNLFVAIFRK